MKRCKHLTTSFVCKTTDDQRIIATEKFCRDCDRYVSLGPSNDAPADVQVEIRAAEIRAAKLCDISTRKRWQLSGEEDRGWNSHGWNFDAQSARQSSGWLAREIATHDYRETRDANAWPWDITRLVAGQYEGELTSTRSRT